MTDETILVVDADQEMDNRIISVLEAEGYMVFAGASQVMTEEMADKLKPSLIYIMPLSANVNGFEPCRKIHTIPKLKSVPIVLLASLKGKIEPQHTEYYGIVDFLRLNFTAEELIAKTAALLPSGQLSTQPAEEAFLPIEEPFSVEEPLSFNEPPLAEESEIATEPPAAHESPKINVPAGMVTKEDEMPREDEEPAPTPAAPASRIAPTRSLRRRSSQSPTLLPWLIGILVALLLGGGGFLAYQHFMPLDKLPTSATKKAAEPALPQQKAAESAPPTAPAAPSVAEPVPSVAKKPSFAVQVGAFKTEEIAAVLVKKLQEKGYEAYAQKGVTKDDSPIIRVLIGSFQDRKAAAKLAADIQSKELIKTTIFTN